MLFVGKSSIQRTHYDILCVKEDANYEEIRASYRSAILNSHPDKLQGSAETSNHQNESEERFLNVRKAWEILSDSRSRALYDRELQASRQDTETADDVNLEDMIVEDGGETLELTYQCRCGDYFVIDAGELEEMGYSLEKGGCKLLLKRPDALPAFVILPCGSCSLKIRLTVDANVKFPSS